VLKLLKGKCRIIIQKDSKSGKIFKVLVYIPTDLARDSQFPFKESGEATVEIKPEKQCILVNA
jgi:hypothetical protein